MKKKTVKKQNTPSLDEIWGSIVILVYGFVTVFTPNMRAFDSNGPKFLTLAIVNLLVFLSLIYVGRKDRNDFFRFFFTKIGLAYGFMIIMALVSFVKAWNINEGILHFAKVFTAFSAAWFVCVFASKSKKTIIPLAIAMSLLLIYDSISTFKEVHDIVIVGKMLSVYWIKASYSNKNILASAIFLKLPFALWLFYIQKGWTRILGIVSLLLGLTAILFLDARAFYLGVIFISFLLLLYGIFRYRQSKGKQHFKIYASYILILFIALGAFTIVRKTMYPKKLQERSGVEQRLKTVTSDKNQSNNLRLTAWGQSLEMIKKDPILGVGIGNWKIRVLEYENKYSVNYTYMYKNHNDFLETTVEYGIFGGLAFLAIFVFILWYFAKVLIIKYDEEKQKWFFLPAFGIVAYSFDAFFNFPQDRPEIQSLFAIYVGISAALVLLDEGENKYLMKFNRFGEIKRKIIGLYLILVTGILLLGSVYILNINLKSLRLQRIVKEESISGKKKTPSERLLNDFPAIPDITVLEEPIAVQKARYLIDEKKYAQAREILRNDNSNPYDGRKEYFMAISFWEENQYDSTLFYAEQALKIKPYFFNTNTIIGFIYEKQKQYDKALKLWENYRKKYRTTADAWRIPILLLQKQGKIDEAMVLADSAYKILPKNADIKKVHFEVGQQIVQKNVKEVYRKAIVLYENNRYEEALPLFSETIKKSPNLVRAYDLRAFCYYFAGKYRETIEDILMEEKLLDGVELSGASLGLIASAHIMLGEREEAKKYYLQAIKKGDKNSETNYKKFFGELPTESKEISFKIPAKK